MTQCVHSGLGWGYVGVGVSGLLYLFLFLMWQTLSKSLCTISIQLPPPTSPKSPATQTGFMVTKQLRMTLNF